jgi:NCAIR mutase (PurE)-related protein
VRKKGAPFYPGNKLVKIYDSGVRGMTRLLKSVSENY